MIEICSNCHTQTANVFCPAGHLAELADFEEHNGVTTGALYTCTDVACVHSMKLHPGSGKTALMLRQAFFNKHLGGTRIGHHRPGLCPPTLQLQQVAPRNRRRTDRVVAAAPVQRAAKRIRRIDAESSEVSFLRKLAPPEEIERFLPRVRELLPMYGAGMRLAKRITGALDEAGIPKASFIVAVASVCEELEDRHAVN